MEYARTQHGGFHYLLFTLALGTVIAAIASSGEPLAMWIMIALAVVFFFAGLIFITLTVHDDGDRLSVRFGPLPILGTRIRYADITSVEPDRTSVLDGWGVHYIPFRGTTYNLWGFGCVKIRLGKRIVRVGSDDLENLVAFLRGKMDQTKEEQP